MQLENIKNIHFIGIGGIGASALAKLLALNGSIVTGSDMNENELTTELRDSDLQVTIGHNAENISPEVELVVYSPAIPPENVEILCAKSKGLPLLSYPQALGQFAQKYFTIAISGTHGKSTTTALTGIILKNLGLKPTVIVGTRVPEFDNKNYLHGEGRFLVVEACEYKESFLNIQPNVLLVNNIEADHLDYFKTAENYTKVFEKLLQNVREEGSVVFNGSHQNVKELIESQWQSNPKNLYRQKVEVSPDKEAKFQFINQTISFNSSADSNLKHEREHQIKIAPGVIGDFNIVNAAMATAVVIEATKNMPQKNGTSLKKIKTIEESIKNFHGTWRRMERKSSSKSTKIFIDDYAHHPSEITTTLKAIRGAYPNKKILCVFQPHQYNRTKNLIHEFAQSFSEVDKVFIPNIYAVRDTAADLASTSPEALVEAINRQFTAKAEFTNGLNNTALQILNRQEEFDIIVTMGAGDIYKIYQYLN